MDKDIEKRERITRFLNDVTLSDTIYRELQDSFMSNGTYGTNVELLAASRIAINLLQDAWKDLAKQKTKTGTIKNDLKQVGM
jgi:hypothetical protein